MYCNVVWLRSVLRAITPYTFSTSEPPKMVRTPSVLYILTWKCASRHNGVHFFDIATSKSGPTLRCFVHFDLEMHNGVQFFIAPVASWLRTRRFSDPTFRPSGATNHWKNTVFRDFPTFSRICIFCPLTLSLLIFLFSLPLPCSAFHLSILSEVWLLNFLRIWIKFSSWSFPPNHHQLLQGKNQLTMLAGKIPLKSHYINHHFGWQNPIRIPWEKRDQRQPGGWSSRSSRRWCSCWSWCRGLNFCIISEYYDYRWW